MDIKLLSIKYENIREFKNLEISFVKENKQLASHHISLVQMPNGTGKTTTMNLLNSAISGDLIGDVRSYSPKDYSPDSGTFELRMCLNDIYYVIKIQLNYVEGNYKFYTSKPSITKGGIEEGHNLPSDIKHTISKEFTDLFIFDGELSEKLLDSRDSSAKDAIETIYFLNKLDILNNRIDTIVEKEQEKSKSKVTKQQGLKQQQTLLKNYRKYRRNLTNRAKEIESDLTSYNTQLTNKTADKDQLFSRYEEINERRIEIKDKLKDIQQSISSETDNLLRNMRIPGQHSNFFNYELKKLADNMVKLKLPKSTSSEFFKEIADSEKCICGVPIDKNRRNYILENAKKYLSEESTSVMNSIKGSIREFTTYESQDHLIDNISENESNYYKLKQELDLLDLQFPTDIREQVERMNNEIDNLQATIDELTNEYQFITSKDDEFMKIYELKDHENLYLCNQKINELEIKVASATETLKFIGQSDILKHINNKVREKSLLKIKQQIKSESNKKISQLLNRDDLLIERIDRSISIKNRSGVSQGQSLAIAYAYLATLFEESNHRIPFVIDSPAGALDIEVRREVSSIIPPLYDQLVIFILSGEREGFMDGIEKFEDIQYITIYKKRDTSEIIYDNSRESFMNFQSDESQLFIEGE